MDKVTMKVDISNLMVEMANTCKTPASIMGTKVALGCLERIAARSCELNDSALLAELKTLCLVVEK